MAAVAVTPASGSITHLNTVVRVTCSAVSNNDATAYSTAIYPTEPQITYYFKFSLTGEDDLVSPVFSTNVDGIAAWDNVLLPAAGTWTLGVYKTADDSSVATASVVVA